MPDYPTQQAFIYDFPKGDFDSVTRSHPALKWLEDYVRNTVETSKWQTVEDDVHDQAFIKTSHGHHHDSADDHYALARKLHERFDSFYHAYDHIIVYETDDGWFSLGTARFYYNTNDGVSSGKERKVDDHHGKRWEGVAPGAYRVHYVKDKNGQVQLSGVEFYNSYLQQE